MTVGFETLVQIHSVAPLFYPADIVVTVHTPNSRIDLRALRGICKIHRHVVLKRNSAGVGT